MSAGNYLRKCPGKNVWEMPSGTVWEEMYGGGNVRKEMSKGTVWGNVPISMQDYKSLMWLLSFMPLWLTYTHSDPQTDIF